MLFQSSCSEIKCKKDKREAFLKKHKLTYSLENFRKKIDSAEKEINKLNPDYIDKIKKIFPLLKKYKNTKQRADNDIVLMNIEQREREKFDLR